ncbi:MAG: Asp-tRNA(Asn)/Glu-tRNA(Gln) amidotransferase subunit GatB [Verrucomicrobiota bacterium]|jgi:aspartyl-tRNA(Asn)/glutamyl-tRNA(Gln) amidotransferase subunit B|nr:Asp-tRNA(Asn)/Glu-tRNA(Gln) amidotransferase subunit GatB [Verrucomicrobiota bacterium]
MEYEAVIGLETHVQLKTHTKMWCGCANEYGSEPNTNVCPVCLGLPGALPVPNAEALRKTALTGFLLNCDVPSYAKWDRKNYFYPDNPKNYQLTQLDFPSTVSGCVEFEFGGGVGKVRVNRAHLEEDVGKSFHFSDFSGVDFNRAGVPLLEIVTEPDISSPDMAYEYLNALKSILEYGGVSDCDMEKGQVRCDVNISVRQKGDTELGEKVEIKNMNSFSGVRRAARYEISRQMEVIESGGELVQETRRWDDDAGITDGMRTKEDAHDYRYFPDPDLMPHRPSEEWLAAVREEVVELPLARKRRFMTSFQLPESGAEVLVADARLGDYFEEVSGEGKNPKLVANWVINNLRAKLVETGISIADLKFSSTAIPELVGLVEEGQISSSIAQEIFADMFETGKDPKVIVEEKGLSQMSDSGDLEAFCRDAIEANPGPVDDFRKGKETALNFLKGQVMKASRGKANPQVVGDLLVKILNG